MTGQKERVLYSLTDTEEYVMARDWAHRETFETRTCDRAKNDVRKAGNTHNTIVLKALKSRITRT